MDIDVKNQLNVRHDLLWNNKIPKESERKLLKSKIIKLARNC